MRTATIVLGALLVAGCSRGDAEADRVAQLQNKVDELEARVRALEASGATSQSEAGMPGTMSQPGSGRVTLTQTWLTPGQPPSTTYTYFTSHGACEKARQQALAQAAETANAQRAQEDRDASAAGSVIVRRAEGPTLQAICSD